MIEVELYARAGLLRQDGNPEHPLASPGRALGVQSDVASLEEGADRSVS